MNDSRFRWYGTHADLAWIRRTIAREMHDARVLASLIMGPAWDID